MTNPPTALRRRYDEWHDKAIETPLTGENVLDAQVLLEDALDTIDELVAASDRLQRAESRYRKSHDIHGADSMSTGQAWDIMRRTGDELRAILARYKGHDE